MPQEQHEFENKLTIAKVSRKIAKPIMEKKRRARINASLNELKNLLVEVLQKEGCRHSNKMEKADILEMAVRHLKNLQRQQGNGTYQSPALHGHDAFATPTEVQNIPSNNLHPNHFALTHQTNEKISPTPSHNSNSSNIVIPQPIKLDYNKLLQSNPAPVAPQGNRNLSAVAQPVMTRTTNGELAVVLPQTFFNQRHCSGNYVLPLFSVPHAAEQSGAQVSSDIKLSPSSELSLAPVSPVWRPW